MLSIEAKQLEARIEDQENGKSRDKSGIQHAGKTAEQLRQEYSHLSIDGTLKKYYKSMRSSARPVRASIVEGQSSLPAVVVKVSISGVFNAYLILEQDVRGRCLSISRIAVFGAGEEV
ncbi:hypothetical protein BG004_000161 [Podila humilis]|nr:hypothetical protein BG004_000161 [Podila humilis]